MTASRLSETDVAARLRAHLPGWTFADGAIARAFRSGGWRAGLSLVNEIAALAESADHHPDVTLRYADVVVRLTTHDAGGVTDRDISLARDIESLFGRSVDPEAVAQDGG
jgi:4a-hydroxytetrahydrobiopterin dehydratase